LNKTKRSFRAPKYFYDEVWKQNFWYFIGWPEEKFKNYLKDYFNTDHDLRSCDGVCIALQGQAESVIAIWTRPKSGARFYEVLSHESFHAAGMTLADRGHIFTYDNDEAMAYLLGAIVRNALS
jgi:hypothetical protein